METVGLGFCFEDLTIGRQPGDTVHAECEVIEARRSHSRRDRGLVRTRVRVAKQDTTIALTYMPLRMVKYRKAEGGC